MLPFQDLVSLEARRESSRTEGMSVVLRGQCCSSLFKSLLKACTASQREPQSTVEALQGECGLLPKFVVSLLGAEEGSWWAALQRKKISKPWFGGVWERSGEKGNESKVCPLSKSPVGGESVGGPRMLSSSQTCRWVCGCQ